MSFTLEIPIASETLSAAELTEITGCSHKAKQIEWLTKRGWLFELNASGNPVVGRMYVRLKLAGMASDKHFAGISSPNFAHLNS